jgi:hypothetical protein
MTDNLPILGIEVHLLQLIGSVCINDGRISHGLLKIQKLSIVTRLKLKMGFLTLLLSILAMIESTSTKPGLVRLLLTSSRILGACQSYIPRCICPLHRPSPSTGLECPL